MIPASTASAARAPVPRWQRGPLQAMRHRDFRLFWFGQLLSLTGTWMQATAKGWLILRLTNSAFALGYVTFIGLLPALPVAVLAGAISDRLPKRKLILMTQAGLAFQALALAALVASGQIQVWHLIALECLWGALGALDQPARQSFVVELAGSEDLTSAIGLNSAAFNATRAVGPALGGLLLASVGEAGCFLANGLSYLAVIAGLLAMRLPDRAADNSRQALGHSVVAGLRYVTAQPVLLALVTLIAVTGFFGTPFMSLLPVFARDVLAVGAKGLGFLSASVGVGAVLGAIAVAAIPRRRGIWLAVGSLAFPAALILFAYARDVRLALATLVLAGAAFVLQQGLTNALIQTLAADRMRGRVMSIYSLSFLGSQQVGSLLAGGVAQVLSAPLAVAVGAIACGAFALGLRLRLPGVNALD